MSIRDIENTNFGNRYVNKKFNNSSSVFIYTIKLLEFKLGKDLNTQLLFLTTSVLA